ncbi:hypothetical protein GCM10010390_21650 [Streptomyces mordarskii]|uniref:Uncharacterized protein n=1 Tax=Streptomyces mordarskii TaxID=1226758 RepID=A0ABN1CHA4_9ACTN
MPLGPWAWAESPEQPTGMESAWLAYRHLAPRVRAVSRRSGRMGVNLARTEEKTEDDKAF